LVTIAGSASVTVTTKGGQSAPAQFRINPQPPTITSLNPDSALAGDSAFTLTISGTNFVSGAKAYWGANSLSTILKDNTQLTASVPASFVAAVGAATVTVTTSGGTSAGARFDIKPAPPAITGLSPASAPAGGAAFTLTVNGRGFYPSSILLWNGSATTTKYVSRTQLKASISAADIATAGAASITVVNSASEGGASLAALFTINGVVQGNVRFVAPNGSDRNPGTINQPYLTVQKCATSVASGGTCEIRAGTYRETVTPRSGITIASYDGELVTMDGADPVTGWTLYKGSIYKAKVILNTGDTNQLFVGNKMMTEARWPNGNDLFNVNWATAQAGTTISKIVDPNLPDVDWTGAKIHLWSGSDPWVNQTGAVTGSSKGEVSIDVGQTSVIPYICPATGGYYYLFGTLAALDAEQEWFYDSLASTLYFWAPAGVDPNGLDVRAKKRAYAFDLSGKSSVTIRNIGLFGSSINMDASSANNVLDGIDATYVSHFTTLPYAPSPRRGYYGFDVEHATDTGIILNGTGNVLRNSSIAYSAGSGVALLGTNSTVENNLIHHADYIGNFSSGIVVASDMNTIHNNTIHTMGRLAIFLYNVHGEDVSYNNLFDAMYISRDGGEIYACCLLIASGSRIHHNWLHDTQSHISGTADNLPSSGLYIDLEDAGFDMDQNILWNNQYYNILIHGYFSTPPSDTNIHNNSVPDVNSYGHIYLDQIPECGNSEVVDNRVLVPVVLSAVGQGCTVTDNNATAPGATEMNSSVQIGCNFAGCASASPPEILGNSVAASIAIQPYDVSAAVGQTATFTVKAAGSAPLSYQWQKNGENIRGAASNAYTTPATTAADNGALFTVQVSNSLGTVTSDPAILTVE
jgi:hypothetical protein